MYSSSFSTLHLIVPFDKFEVDVLRELNVAPTQLHLNVWVTMCAFRVLCQKTKKVDWISLTDILDKAVIGPYTTSYKNFKGYFFQVPSKLEFMPIDFTRQRVLKFPFYWNLSPIMFIKKKPIIYMYDSDQKDMGKYFNHQALIQASMLSQPNRDILREVGPHEPMDSIVRFAFKRANAVCQKVQSEYAKAEQALVEESQKSLMDTKTKLKEAESQEKALKIKLTTAKDSAKALQEEINHLNKEFVLIKVNAKKVEEKLKTDLEEAEAKILKTHEAGPNKAFHLVKYFFKDANTSFFDVDKDVTQQGELVGENNMPTKEVLDLA
ncbi:hypothetical protein JHK82_053083 [Glycine max]|uniref:Uncharacterized protein n=1 Tax=Glycine max TaxID=3847 RepID=A0A0R0EVM9_SOYBN|nr:hypothetical protein JHK86_052928 [Glycine max]KAG4927302.1 hypothetical protein JHK85_053788 [Glycine max]KAG5082919.1 hypothetical protein JHK84_052957 [Glycine max]KAG5085686.1 hypothetical protein JHK82_053083 [Glycine max]